jgi:hypothetical protein
VADASSIFSKEKIAGAMGENLSGKTYQSRDYLITMRFFYAVLSFWDPLW